MSPRSPKSSPPTQNKRAETSRSPLSCHICASYQLTFFNSGHNMSVQQSNAIVARVVQ